jgi:hypothetical protein
MSTAAIVGGSPISFLDKHGRQFGIPLSLLAIKDGVIDRSRLGEPLATDAEPVLNALLSSGAIAAGATSAPIVALTLRAKLAGTAGNTLSVRFDNVVPKTPPGDSTAKVKVTFEDRRRGLTKDSVGAELGTPAGGTKPGLVVLQAAAAGPPKAMAATKLAGSPLALDVPAKTGSAPAFTLQAAGTEPFFADLKVAIIEVGSADDTFTLVISLDHTEAALKVGDIDVAFGPLLEVVGTPAAAPAEGEIKLAGGADPETSTAKTAEASVLSE